MVDSIDIPSTIEEVTSSLEAERSEELQSLIDPGSPLDESKPGTLRSETESEVECSECVCCDKGQKEANYLLCVSTCRELRLRQSNEDLENQLKEKDKVNEQLQKQVDLFQILLQRTLSLDVNNNQLDNQESSKIKKTSSRFNVSRVEELPRFGSQDAEQFQRKKSVKARMAALSKKLGKVTRGYFTVY